MKKPDPRLQGKVVLITGASSGIGAALARELVARGAKVALTARRTDRLEALAEELGRENALAIAADVTRDGDIERATDETVRSFGKLDIAVANAGFGVVGNFDSLTLDDYRRQFETNVFGAIRTLHAALAEVKKNRGGLVLVSSVAGYVALPGGSAYSMSKFAVRALGEAMELELAPQGVAVTTILPGFVKSEIHQIDNLGRLHEASSKQPIPEWIHMDTQKAARQIVDAIAKRKGAAVITFHGKAATFVQRHFPGTLRAALRAAGLKARNSP